MGKSLCILNRQDYSKAKSVAQTWSLEIYLVWQELSKTETTLSSDQ